MATSPGASDRRGRLAETQRRHRRRELRRSLLIVVPTVAIVTLLVGWAVYVVAGERQTSESAGGGIDGVQEFKDLSRNHVEAAVQYPQSPPVGGDHNSVWTNCAAYNEPVEPTQAVHSLEHGAVWIGYTPDLAAAQVKKLTAIAEENSYVLLSPVDEAASSITLTAWGKQLNVESAEDSRVAAFVQKYQRGPQTPEPGAACTGGAGAM